MPQDKPAKIGLNLDSVERDGVVDPYVIVLNGKRYVLTDVQECDYRELLTVQRAMMGGEPEKALEILISDEDKAEFFANKLPNWKVEKLMRGYNEHYGLPTPGEAPASSPS